MLAVVEGAFGSGAEELTHQLLGECPSPGLVVFNVFATPSRGKDPKQIDAVLWTPARCVAVEVKGFTARRGGSLRATTNGKWLLDGRVAPVNKLVTEKNAFQQVLAQTFALRGDLKWRAGRDAFVEGLVVLVPHSGTEVTIASKEPPRGVDLVIANAENRSALEAVVAQMASGPETWSAADVAAALRSLNIAEDIGEAELLAAGFPQAVAPTRSRRQPGPAAAPAAVAPAPAAVGPVVEEPSDPPAPDPAATTAAEPVPQPTASTTPTPAPPQPVPAQRSASPSAPSPATVPPPVTNRPLPVAAQQIARPTRTRGLVRRPRRAARPRVVRSPRPPRWRQRLVAVAGAAAILTLAAPAAVGLYFMVSEVASAAFTSSKSPLAPVAMMTENGNIGCVIGTDVDGDFIRCDVAQYAYPLPARPADCAPEDFGHTIVLRGGRAPTYACAQDFLLDTALPVSNSMTAGKFSCSLWPGATISCRESGGARFVLSRNEFRIE